MRFVRHAESIGPMCPSSAMSSGRLFLGRLLASIAHLRFPGICELTMIAPGKKITTIER
jgi:hypothetical protein